MVFVRVGGCRRVGASRYEVEVLELQDVSPRPPGGAAGEVVEGQGFGEELRA